MSVFVKVSPVSGAGHQLTPRSSTNSNLILLSRFLLPPFAGRTHSNPWHLHSSRVPGELCLEGLAGPVMGCDGPPGRLLRAILHFVCVLWRERSVVPVCPDKLSTLPFPSLRP